MASAMTKAKDESALDVREAQGGARFPWERLPGESIQAYRRFMQYRLMPAGERSLRKLEVHYSLAARWAKRWRWTARTCAWDDQLSESIDGLSSAAALGARYRAARLGSAFARQAERKLSEVKLTSVDDLVNLAKSGVAIERQALMLTDAQGDTRLDRAPVANVAISLGSNGSTPPWLTRPITEGQVNASETEPRPVVPVAAQVIAGGSSASRQRPEVNTVKRLAEKIVKSPKAGNK